jgi:hypothetical protein
MKGRDPAERSTVAIWSIVADSCRKVPSSAREPALYGWAAGSRADIAERCRTRSAGKPPERAHRPALRVKDGWAFGRTYKCERRGRVVIQTAELRVRTRMTVWMEKTRELIAVGELRRGSGSVRASKRCGESPN